MGMSVCVLPIGEGKDARLRYVFQGSSCRTQRCCRQCPVSQPTVQSSSCHLHPTHPYPQGQYPAVNAIGNAKMDGCHGRAVVVAPVGTFHHDPHSLQE